jgi:GNAT superfamily N-acetyltransferase
MPIPPGKFEQHRPTLDYRIEPGRPADLDQIMTLIADVIAGLRARGIDQWDEIYPDRNIITADLAAGTLSIAEGDGGLLGMIVLNEHQEPQYASVDWRFQSGRCLVVHRLCVHPEAEGKGVATALMAFAEATGRGLGYGAVRLDAFTGNPRAVALYERLGYRKAGEVTFRKGRFYCYEKLFPKRSGSKGARTTKKPEIYPGFLFFSVIA